MIKQLETENPKLAVIGDPSTLASRGEKLVAVDPALAFTTVSVEVHPADGTPSRPSTSDLESMVPDMSDSLKHVGGTVDSHRVTTINGRRVLQLTFHDPLQLGG